MKKCIEKENPRLPSKNAHIDGDYSQILDNSALPPEARSPQVFDDTACDENVAHSTCASHWQY